MDAGGDVVAAAAALAALGAVPDDDPRWSRTAAPTSWTASGAVEHVGDALLLYAGQVARRATGRLPVPRSGRPGPPSEQLEVAVTAAHLLAAALRDLGDERAWHPSGVADASGWAAMAVTELLVHAHDAAGAVGVQLVLPAEVCARVLARTFPWVEPGAARPEEALLAVTGRARVEGVPDDPLWWWWSAPLAAWDGRPHRRTSAPAWR